MGFAIDFIALAIEQFDTTLRARARNAGCSVLRTPIPAHQNPFCRTFAAQIACTTELIEASCVDHFSKATVQSDHTDGGIA